MFTENTKIELTPENNSDQIEMKDAGSFDVLNTNIVNTLWLSVSEAAKLGGVQGKTIRRAIKANVIKFKIIGNRYLIDFSSLISFLHSSTKLKNKLNDFGIGQYVDNWKK